MSRIRIPILMYHHVNPHKGDVFTVTPEVFEGQMAYLAKAGYKALSLDELLAFIKGDLDLKQRGVVITFDDGWLDNYIYAFPVLERYKLRAAMFIVTDWIAKASQKLKGVPTFIPINQRSKTLVENGEDQKAVFTWELIGKMADTGLVDFYSHTRSHRSCNDLSEPELLEELGESRRILEEQLGIPCPYLCWPYGRSTNKAIAVAKEVGYKALFTIEPGFADSGSDPYEIKRILVGDNVSQFIATMLLHPIILRCYGAVIRKWGLAYGCAGRTKRAYKTAMRKMKRIGLIRILYIKLRNLIKPSDYSPLMSLIVTQSQAVVLKPWFGMKGDGKLGAIVHEVVKDFVEHYGTLRLKKATRGRLAVPSDRVLLRHPLALMRMPLSHEEYLKKAGAETRNKNIRNVENQEYEFREFDWNNYLEDIFEINMSNEVKRPGSLHGWYLKPVSPRHHSEQELHYRKYYGVFRDGRLLAYSNLMLCGNFGFIKHLMTHTDHEKHGVVYYLVSCAIRELIGNPIAQWLNYGWMPLKGSETEEVIFVKRHLGFEPYAVLFDLEDDQELLKYSRGRWVGDL